MLKLRKVAAILLSAAMLLSTAACGGGGEGGGNTGDNGGNSGNNNASTGDNTAPTISGVMDSSVQAGNEFDAMAGVTANDAEDGDVTAKITITSVPELTFSNGKVTPADPGDYELTYSVVDKGGLEGNAYATLTVTKATADAVELFNLDFTQPGDVDDHGWAAHIADGVAATGEHKMGAFVFDITDPGQGDGDIQLIKSGMEIKAADYRVKVWAKSTAPTYAHLLARNEQAEEWETFGGTYNAPIGTEIAPIELTFTAPAEGTVELILNLGKITPNPDNPTDTTPENFTVTIDKIEIYEISGEEHEVPVYNNDFSTMSIDAVSLSAGDGANGSGTCAGDGTGVFQIDNYPTEGGIWSIKADMTLGGNTIESGTKYYYRFTVKSEQDQTGELLVESLSQNDAARADFYSLNLTAGEEITITHSFTAGASVSDPVVRMQIGNPSAGVTSNTITVTNLEFGTMEGDLETVKTIDSFAAPYNGDSYKWGVYNGTDEDNERGVGTIWTQDGVLSYRIDQGGATDWHNKLYMNMTLPADSYFTVEITAKASQPVSCSFALNPAGSWDPRLQEGIDFTTEEQTFSFTTTETLIMDMDFEMLFQFGSADLASMGEVTIEFSNITIWQSSVV